MLTFLLPSCVVGNILNNPALQKKSPALAPASNSASLAPLGLGMVSVAQELGKLLGLIRDFNSQLQRLQNQLFFGVKASGLPGWDFSGGVYTLAGSARDTQVTLKISDNQGRIPEWDVMDISNYGPPPKKATRFPAELTQFQVQVEKKQALDTTAVLKATLTGTPPRQFPLEGNFEIPFSGSGSVEGHPQFTQLTFLVNGKANRDGSLLNGQVSFEGLYNLKTYNGTGSFNQNGLGDRIPILHNGQSVGEIVRNGAKWDVCIFKEEKCIVIATGG